jgi:hypothetical protein
MHDLTTETLANTDLDALVGFMVHTRGRGCSGVKGAKLWRQGRTGTQYSEMLLEVTGEVVNEKKTSEVFLRCATGIGY